jgi:hypothetical protein
VDVHDIGEQEREGEEGEGEEEGESFGEEYVPSLFLCQCGAVRWSAVQCSAVQEMCLSGPLPGVRVRSSTFRLAA